MATIAFYTAEADAGQQALVRAIADAAAKRDDGTAPAIIRLGPEAGRDNDAALRSADLVVVPVRPVPAALAEVGSALDTITRCGTPFVFVIHDAGSEDDSVGAAIMVLAQHGAICPMIVPKGEAVPAAGVLNYLLERLARVAPGQAPPAAASEPGRDRRRFPRWECDVPAVLAWDGVRIGCRIVDISGGGMAVAFDPPPAPGTPVTIECESIGTVTGVVRHVSGNQIGMRFTLDAATQTDLIMNMAISIKRATPESPTA